MSTDLVERAREFYNNGPYTVYSPDPVKLMAAFAEQQIAEIAAERDKLKEFAEAADASCTYILERYDMGGVVFNTLRNLRARSREALAGESKDKEK